MLLGLRNSLRLDLTPVLPPNVCSQSLQNLINFRGVNYGILNIFVNSFQEGGGTHIISYWNVLDIHPIHLNVNPIRSILWVGNRLKIKRRPFCLFVPLVAAAVHRGGGKRK